MADLFETWYRAITNQVDRLILYGKVHFAPLRIYIKKGLDNRFFSSY